MDLRQLSAWTSGIFPRLKADHMSVWFKTFKEEGIVVFTMDGQKVRMVMGLCLLRIITMVTRASQDTFNGEPSASWRGAAGVPWQGHDPRLETKPKMISQFWNKGLPPKLQSQMLPLRILQGSINQRSRTGRPGWDQQPEILLQVINTNCNRKLCSIKYFLSVSKELYFLPVIQSGILTKYHVLIASVASDTMPSQKIQRHS